MATRYRWLLEDGSGYVLLEDDSGYVLLEEQPVAFDGLAAGTRQVLPFMRPGRRLGFLDTIGRPPPLPFPAVVAGAPVVLQEEDPFAFPGITLSDQVVSVWG
jgi:hypothetical protein